MASYDEVLNDPAKGHFAKYTAHEGNRLTVAKYTAKGLTAEKIHAYYNDLCANAYKLNSRSQVTKIDEHEGFTVLHAVTSLPWPMSNRSTIMVLYKFEEDGCLTFIQSSKGCEEFVTAHAKSIGKNVVASNHINYACYTPIEGGYEIATVMCADPAGSIPDVLKNKFANRTAQQPYILGNFMLTGALPTDLS